MRDSLSGRRRFLRIGILSAFAGAIPATASGQPRQDRPSEGPSPPEHEGTEASVTLLRGYFRDFFNAHDPSAATRYLTPDFKAHNGFLGTRDGRDAFMKALGATFRGLPDVHAAEQDIIASGDRVVIRLLVEGTHTGPFLGVAPTGRRLRWGANQIYRFEGDRIAEEWAAEDWTAVFQQLGLFQPPTGH